MGCVHPSPPAHAARWVTAVSQGVPSQCHQVTPRSVAILCLQATSQLPAWPQPSLSLVEQFGGLAARRLLAGFHPQQHRGHRLAYSCLFPPGSLRTPARCRWHVQADVPGVSMSLMVVSVSARWPRLVWEAPPSTGIPPHPTEGAQQSSGTNTAGQPPSFQPPLSSSRTGLGDNRSPGTGRGDLVQPSELNSGGTKGFAKTSLRSGTAAPVLGTTPKRRPNIPSPTSPLLLLVATGDTPGCPAAPASLPYAARQLSRGSPAALPTVGRRPGLIKIVLGSI